MTASLFIPAHDSNENLTAMSGISDTSNPPSRRNSFGANDYNQVNLNYNYKNDFFNFHRVNNLKMVYEHINSIELIIPNI